MNAKELKGYLLEDHKRIEQVLEEYGFHGINYNGSDLRCALPDGRNRTSVSIKLNEGLLTSCFSSGNEYRGDLFGFIEERTEKPFKTVIRDIHKILGINYTKGSFKKSNKIDLLSGIRKYKANQTSENKENKLYGKYVLNQYITIPHLHILQEHISGAVYEQFDICYDERKDRIIFPHYDWKHHDKIVGLVGRTCVNKVVADELGIPKYWNYIRGYMKSHNLYGYSQAVNHIDDNEMIIIFEGEKSVLKQFTMTAGKGYSVSVGGHEINKVQADFIIKNTTPETEVVIAFDKDVMEMKDNNGEHIGEKFLIEQCQKFIPFRRASYIYDTDGLLGEKDSPVDEGVYSWMELLENRKVVDVI